MSEDLLDLNPEEIGRLSKMLADAFAEHVARVEPSVVTCVSGYEVVRECYVAEVVDLDLIASATHGITDILGQIAEWFRAVIDTVASWIVASVQAFVSGVVNTVSSIINTVTSAVSGFISDAVSTISRFISDAISSIISGISNLISNVISAISGAISGIITAISTAISGAISAILNAISGIMTAISSALSGVASAIMDALKGVISTVSNIISGIVSTLSSIFGSIASAVMNAITGVVSTISAVIGGIISTISGVLSGIASAIMNAITGVISALSGIFNTIASAIMSAISGIITAISGILSGVASAIMNAISGFIEAVSGVISTVAKTIIDALSTVGKTIYDALLNFVEIISNTFGMIGKTIMDVLTGIGKGIMDLWNFLVGVFQDIAAKIGAGFQALGNAVMGFINAILKFPEWFPNWFYNSIAKPIMDALSTLGELIWKALPEWLREGLEAIGSFFKGIADAIIEFFKDPIGSLGRLAQSIWDLIQEFGKRVWEGLTWIWNTIVSTTQSIIKTVWDAIQGFASWLWESTVNAFKTVGEVLFGGLMTVLTAIGESVVKALSVVASGILNIANSVAEAIGRTVTEFASLVFAPIFSTFTSRYADRMVDISETFARSSSVEEDLGYLFSGIGLIVKDIILAHALAYGISHGLQALASVVDDIEVRPTTHIMGGGEGGLEPIGIGARLRALLGWLISLGWHFKPSYIIREMGKDVRLMADQFTRGLMYGITIWSTQPISKLLNAALRDALVVELPPVDTTQEVVRRHMPTKDFEAVLKDYRTILKLYGYRTSIIEWLTSTELKIDVTDRFGITRIVPLALMYELPSASDVATMMVRDIFATIDDFQRLYLARGMHPDIGALYYFLRFRYPPPERLWQFTVRGISGLLWATVTQDELRDIADEASKIGAPLPTSPIEWNFRASELFTAFKEYMKWHDMARFTWFDKRVYGWDKNFTSDNLIYIDTLADIPSKIDLRWYVKWGVFELLSSKQVTHLSPVRDFARKVLEQAPVSEIVMDLTNFSRTLQATGLHPDWVPTTAVAEAMNVLSEERTLLRTGFIGLFKEGFYDVKALDVLLAGFVKASFKVAYFDSEKMQWTTGYINIPVMYLPPERKLLELRALMDRCLDILRDIQRDAFTAYQEFIIWDKNEFEAKLGSVIKSINEVYASDYEAITGVKLPPELQLRYVKEYYDKYLDALKIWREVFTVRRIRMWTQRWLGWIMYRVAYGVVSREDVEKLVTHVSEKARLTNEEREFIQQVMDIMYGIARRSTVAEYLPTPSTLATLSEYLALDEGLVREVLRERGLDAVWEDIWIRYITVKPIKSDAKSLLSTYVRAFRYGVVSKAVVDDYVKTLPQYGFTQREIEFIMKAVDLEEQILEARSARAEYIPTPTMLVTLAEYVSIPSELVSRVFEARRIPKEWADIWLYYLNVRPIADDVRVLANAYYRAKRYQIPLGEVEKQILDILKVSGMTDRELAIRDLATQIEIMVSEYLESRREYIPTPLTLATICEYIPEARRFYEAVVKARRIPKEWHELWARYIDIRPLVDDLKRYLSRAEALYVRFMIKKPDFEKILNEVSGYLGYTAKEIEFLMKVTEFERYRNAWTELIGSVERLVELSEYSPKAASYALGKLYEMIDALPLSPTEKQNLKEMWEEYIRNRPVKSEARTYITQLINLYVDGLITDAAFKKELWEMKKWGFSDNELMFYEAQAVLRKARKLRIPIGE